MTQVDQAKLTEYTRTRLAEMTVQREVISELQALADERLRELYRQEGQLRELFKQLGIPLADGPFDAAAIMKGLDGLTENTTFIQGAS